MFDGRRAAQVTYRVLRDREGSEDLLRLMKLLYLVDREAMLRSGLPITGDQPWALDHGPVPSRIYDVLKGREFPWRMVWDRYVSRRGNLIMALPDPEAEEADRYDTLSPWDFEVIDTVIARFGAWPTQRLLDYVHELPEFQPPPRGSSRPMDFVQVLANSDDPKRDDKVERFRRTAREEALFDQIFDR